MLPIGTPDPFIVQSVSDQREHSVHYRILHWEGALGPSPRRYFGRTCCYAVLAMVQFTVLQLVPIAPFPPSWRGPLAPGVSSQANLVSSSIPFPLCPPQQSAAQLQPLAIHVLVCLTFSLFPRFVAILTFFYTHVILNRIRVVFPGNMGQKVL